MCARDVRDVGEASDLEIQAASVDSSELQCGGAIMSNGVHDVVVISAIGLWRLYGGELDFCEGESEKATDTYQPSIFKVWQ